MIELPTVALRASDISENIQPPPDDPVIAKQENQTYWESNG